MANWKSSLKLSGESNLVNNCRCESQPKHGEFGKTTATGRGTLVLFRRQAEVSFIFKNIDLREKRKLSLILYRQNSVTAFQILGSWEQEKETITARISHWDQTNQQK